MDKYFIFKSKILGFILLDGSRTPAKRGGEAVGNQGRKASIMSNTLPNFDVNPRNNKSLNQSTEYLYFNETLYKRRTVIEHANAWMDKALLLRFESQRRTA